MKHEFNPLPLPMNVIDAIFARRSIRRYTDQPVEPEKLLLLLQAAMAAPSACNSNPWEFVVVTEPEPLQNLRSRLYSGQYNAPAAIVVCGNETIANSSVARFFWPQDCSAAVENILLAAVGLGLGTVWIGCYPLPTVIKPVSAALNLPAHVIPLGIIYVGYPAEEKRPRTRYDERRVYWQEYQPRKKRRKIKNAKYQE